MRAPVFLLADVQSELLHPVQSQPIDLTVLPRPLDKRLTIEAPLTPRTVFDTTGPKASMGGVVPLPVDSVAVSFAFMKMPLIAHLAI